MTPIYDKYGPKGLEILAFPCNQFGKQEPNSDKDILDFAEKNYKVKYPMFSKIEVNGENASPLYKYLKTSQQFKQQEPTGNIKWNFAKFLVDRNGNVVQYYLPTINPNDIVPDIEKQLNRC